MADSKSISEVLSSDTEPRNQKGEKSAAQSRRDASLHSVCSGQARLTIDTGARESADDLDTPPPTPALPDYMWSRLEPFLFRSATPLKPCGFSHADATKSDAGNGSNVDKDDKDRHLPVTTPETSRSGVCNLSPFDLDKQLSEHRQLSERPPDYTGLLTPPESPLRLEYQGSNDQMAFGFIKRLFTPERVQHQEPGIDGTEADQPQAVPDVLSRSEPIDKPGEIAAPSTVHHQALDHEKDQEQDEGDLLKVPEESETEEESFDDAPSVVSLSSSPTNTPDTTLDIDSTPPVADLPSKTAVPFFIPPPEQSSSADRSRYVHMNRPGCVQCHLLGLSCDKLLPECIRCQRRRSVRSTQAQGWSGTSSVRAGIESWNKIEALEERDEICVPRRIVLDREARSESERHLILPVLNEEEEVECRKYPAALRDFGLEWDHDFEWVAERRRSTWARLEEVLVAKEYDGGRVLPRLTQDGLRLNGRKLEMNGNGVMVLKRRLGVDGCETSCRATSRRYEDIFATSGTEARYEQWVR